MWFRCCFLAFLLIFIGLDAALAAKGGGFGGGGTGGGGASGSWGDAEEVAVKCDGYAVGYSENKKCSEYNGGSAFNHDDADMCRRTCTESKGKGVWDWTIVSCVNGYHTQGNKCEKDASVKPVKALAPAVTALKVHGTVLILDSTGKDYEGAIGASVQLRDKPSVGVAADMDGGLNLTIDKESDVLRVSYVGYKEETILARQCLNGCTIKLKQNPINLDEVTVIGCNNQLRARLNELATGCAGGDAQMLATIRSLQNHCDNIERLSDFDAVYAKVKDIDPAKCVEKLIEAKPVVAVVSQPSRKILSQAELVAISHKKIDAAAASISSWRSQLGQSVWKDKNGNFNTSRLVSDSVAGVVLGTAGGLITSSVIKKNQVKGGFEGIHCTVGGQIIADYGDDVTIGIR